MDSLGGAINPTWHLLQAPRAALSLDSFTQEPFTALHSFHFVEHGLFSKSDTLPSQLKSQTDRGWSPATMEVLLASCAPSVNGFSETAFLNTPCHTISRIFPSPCTWILLLWFLKKTLGQLLHATQSATFFNLHVTWILLKWLLKLFPYTDQRCKKNKGEQYFIHS